MSSGTRDRGRTQGRSLVLAMGCALTLAGCPSAPNLYNGPAPEYEPPRRGPLEATSPTPMLPEDDVVPGPPYGDATQLRSNIDAFIAGHGKEYGPAYRPSGVLLVAHEGKRIFEQGYGSTSPAGGSRPDANTRFRIGSVTKSLVAVATISLAADHKLSLADSVRKHVPELPESYQGITLLHLLKQTSGIVNYTNDAMLLAKKAEELPRASVISFLAKNAPTSAPGERFGYSNSNYFLLGVALENATKQPLDALLLERVFGKASMTRSGSALMPDDAGGMTRGPSGGLIAADRVDNSIAFSSGHLSSTATDLAAFWNALRAGKLLDSAHQELLFAPEKGGYAAGFVAGKIAGKTVHWHNGAIDGFSTFFGHAPDADITVVYVGNVFEFDGTKTGMSVMEMALTGKPLSAPQERETRPLDEALAKQLAGDYVLSKASRAELEKSVPAPVLESIGGFTFAFSGGGLSGKPIGQGTFPMLQAKEGPLFNPALSLEITPTLDAGKLKGFTLKQGATTAHYERGKLPKPKVKPKR